MERRSPTGIAAREGRETTLSQKAGTKPSGFAAISFRGNGAPVSDRHRPPRGGRNPPNLPEHKRGNGAPVSDRHRPPRGGRNPPNLPEHKRGNGAPVSDRHRPPRGGRNPPNLPEHKRGYGAPVSDRHRPPRGGRNPPTCQSTSAEMERRSPTGIDRREAVETTHRCPRGPRNHVPPIRLTVQFSPALLPSPRYAPAPVGHGGCHASCWGNRQSGTVASENVCAEPRSAALGTLPALCPIGGSPRSLSTPIRLFAQLPATPGRC